MLSLPGASTRLHSSMATARATPTSPMRQVTTRRATRLKRSSPRNSVQASGCPASTAVNTRATSRLALRSGWRSEARSRDSLHNSQSHESKNTRWDRLQIWRSHGLGLLFDARAIGYVCCRENTCVAPFLFSRLIRDGERLTAVLPRGDLPADPSHDAVDAERNGNHQHHDGMLVCIGGPVSLLVILLVGDAQPREK